MAGRLLCWDALLQAEPAGPGSALPRDLRAAAQTPVFSAAEQRLQYPSPAPESASWYLAVVVLVIGVDKLI